jgi:hypothetical protein
MAKNDNNIMTFVLLGGGAFALWYLYENNYLQTWFPSLFSTPIATAATVSTPVTTTTTPVTTTPVIAAPVSTTTTSAPLPGGLPPEDLNYSAPQVPQSLPYQRQVLNAAGQRIYQSPFGPGKLGLISRVPAAVIHSGTGYRLRRGAI